MVLAEFYAYGMNGYALGHDEEEAKNLAIKEVKKIRKNIWKGNADDELWWCGADYADPFNPDEINYFEIEPGKAISF